MKNKLSLFIVPLFAGMLFFISCEKDDKTVSKKDLLVNHVWEYDSLQVSDINNAGLLFTAAAFHMSYQNGEMDFNNDGTYDLTSSIISLSGVWELVNNKTIILDKATDDEMVWEILTINSSEAHFKMHVEGDFFSTPYEGDITLLFKAK
jgi:hypothetical protein